MIHTPDTFLTDNTKLVLCRICGYKYHISPYKTLTPGPASSLTVALTWKPTQRFHTFTVTMIHILMTAINL